MAPVLKAAGEVGLEREMVVLFNPDGEGKGVFEGAVAVEGFARAWGDGLGKVRRSRDREDYDCCSAVFVWNDGNAESCDVVAL